MDMPSVPSIHLFHSWERRFDYRDRAYYVDHNTRTTTWQMPTAERFLYPSAGPGGAAGPGGDGMGTLDEEWGECLGMRWR